MDAANPRSAADSQPRRDAPATHRPRVWLLPALALTTVLLVTAERYGPHGDELYFAMLPVRWSYVDQPPLTVWATQLMAQISDDLWVQRLPAVMAAAAGVAVTAAICRAAGGSHRAQRLASWGHACGVYPLLMGHLFITATWDFLAWQIVALCVVRAVAERPQWLVVAGAVVAVAAWNKLLILVYTAAAGAALLLTRRDLLRNRYAWWGATIVVLGSAPPLWFQVQHGLPMATINADLEARQGTLIRLLLIPVTVAFLGPVLAPVWWRGLLRPWRHVTGAVQQRWVLPAAIVVLVWAVAFPGQPYYAVPAFFPAVAIGWTYSEGFLSGGAKLAGGLAAQAVVAILICLPVLPRTSPVLPVMATINPTVADQLDWHSYALQMSDAAKGSVIVTDRYDLAGAAHRYTSAPTFSGHNALWNLGHPTTSEVLLVGDIATTHTEFFARCAPAGKLSKVTDVPSRVDGTSMTRCQDPAGSWEQIWPRFRRLGG